jgi:hypothetical protein
MAVRRGAANAPPMRESVPRLHSGVQSRKAPLDPDGRAEPVPSSEAPTMPPPAISAEGTGPRVDVEIPGVSGKYPRARRQPDSEPNLGGATADTVTADLRRDPRSE